jgi:pimeloyl-ACP methyl ester carboxylesterase
MTGATTGTVPTSDGLELFYERRGGGQDVVVVPSASWVARDMDALAPDRSVVFYDIRGRGRSSAILDEAHLALERDVDDLEVLRAALGIERMALVGWSYHGALAARYALAHPGRVERLLMVGPTAPAEEPYWMDFLERFGLRCKTEWLRELEVLRRAGTKESDPLKWCRAVHEVFFRAYVADQASLERMKSCPCVEPNLDADRVNDQGRRLLEKLGAYDWRGEFDGLSVPTLLLHGAEDPVALSGTEEWHRILPDSQLLVWEEVGHMPWIEVPERFFDVANRFLAGEWPVADGAGEQ